MKKIMVLLIAAFFISGLAQGKAKASSYDLTYLINGYQPNGSSWLTADFADTGLNQVTLTLTSNLSSYPTYYFQEVLFNVNPGISPSSLTITQQSASSGTVGIYFNNGNKPPFYHIANTTDDAQVMVGSGPLGRNFDIKLEFTKRKTGRFDNSDSVTFLINGSGINADSFNFLNAADTAHVGAHLAGIPGSLSGAISDMNLHPAPIPGAVWILGSGLLGLLGIRRRIS